MIKSFTQEDLNKLFGKNQGYWEYRSLDDEFICYTVRYDRPEGGKDIRPWSMQGGNLCIGMGGRKEKPIYNLQLLSRYPNKPVMIVEGEKAADAGSRYLPDYNVLTWMGGVSTAGKPDWSVLSDKTVYLLPDADDVGYKAMETIRNNILPIAKTVYFIDIKKLGVSEKWDLADLDLDHNTVDVECLELFIEGTKPSVYSVPTLDKDSFPNLSVKGNILNMTSNVAHLLNHYQNIVRYNLMTNYPEFHAPGKSFSTVNEADCHFTEISNLCVLNGVPKVDLDDHLNLISESNKYHPAIEFILSRPWDGISRIDEFMSTVEAENQVLAKKLIYRWMLSCVAAPFCDKGIAVDGILIFQGPQRIGKTHWFIKLVPDSHRSLIKTSLILDPDNKDSVMNCTSCWLGELGEIDGTLRKSEVSSQKQFITKNQDQYRVPFGRKIKIVPRRTVFFGSVNPTQYLIDETGNRRFWSITVKKINHNHDIDMQQVWAEFKTLLDSGESYRLTDEEHTMLNAENELFETMDPIEEEILCKYRWDEEERNLSLTCRQVLEDLGYEYKANNFNTLHKRCTSVLTKLTGKKARKSSGLRLFEMPRMKQF